MLNNTIDEKKNTEESNLTKFSFIKLSEPPLVIIPTIPNRVTTIINFRMLYSD